MCFPTETCGLHIFGACSFCKVKLCILNTLVKLSIRYSDNALKVLQCKKEFLRDSHFFSDENVLLFRRFCWWFF